MDAGPVGAAGRCAGNRGRGAAPIRRSARFCREATPDRQQKRRRPRRDSPPVTTRPCFRHGTLMGTQPGSPADHCVHGARLRGRRSAQARAETAYGTHPVAVALLDGAWWPRSADLDAELRALVLAHLLLDADEWGEHPRRLVTAGRRVRLGWSKFSPPN